MGSDDGDGTYAGATRSAADREFVTNGGVSTLSAVLRAVSDPRRREVLYYLREHDTATIGELARHCAAVETGESPEDVPTERYERIRTQLHHTHLPKLTDALVVEYDERTNTVSYSAPPDAVEMVLDVVAQLENVDDEE
jgi:hypothetical protein